MALALALLTLPAFIFLAGARITPGPRMTFVQDILPLLFAAASFFVALSAYRLPDRNRRITALLVAGLAALEITLGGLAIYASFAAPYSRGPIFAWW